MQIRLPGLVLAAAFVMAPAQILSAQARGAVRSAKAPERAIRRDIPLTNMIRRAFAAGTRDSSGRPGPHYWQIGVDYTISARLDQGSSRIAGREAVVVHNRSDSALRTIQMRLDQNLFAPNVPRAEVVTDITDGMKLTKLVVAGQPVDLNAPPPRRAGRRGGAGDGEAGPAVNAITGASLTSATIHLATPVARAGIGHAGSRVELRSPAVGRCSGDPDGTLGRHLYQVAQWYPRVAVYDDLRGWDTDPYLGPSEFYNNLGHYDVQLDIPGRLAGRRDRRAPESEATYSPRPRASGCRTSPSRTRSAAS